MSIASFERSRRTRALPIFAALAAALASASAHAGDITQYPSPTSASLPYGIAIGNDNNVWFAEYDGNKIGVISQGGQFLHEYPIPTPKSFPITLTGGPDGMLWFTEFDGGKIGRIDLNGAIVEYATPNGRPYGLVSGPDGNLWFTEFNANRIGVMTRSGVILNEFPLPVGSTAYSIASAVDGNLWFTDMTRDAIGKITRSGVITEYPTPTLNSAPMFISSGPGGDLWFTEYTGNKIGRISTAGVITEYPIPTPNSDPEGIDWGAQGDVAWFVENVGEKLGMITADGTITEYPFASPPWENPGAQVAHDINGNIWLTLGATNSLYKFTTQQSPTVSMTFAPTALVISGNNSGPAALTITLTNPNSTDLTGVALTDYLPTGLYGTYMESTCGGTLAPSTSSFTFITLSGGTIPALASCSVGVQVYANATGGFVDSSGAVISDNAPPSTAANATLTVRQLPPLPIHCSPSGGCN